MVSVAGGVRGIWCVWLLAGASALALTAVSPAVARSQVDEVGAGAVRLAQAEQTYEFDIPSKPLPRAIADFSAVTGLQVLYTETSTYDHTAPALRGAFTARQALERLVAGSGLSYRYTSANAVTLERDVAQEGDGPMRLRPITVEAASPADPGRTEGTGSYTGSRVSVGSKIPTSIRETPQSVSVVTRQRMDDQNFTTLQDAMKQTTGMTVQRFDGAGHFNRITARGYEANSVLLDGVSTSADGNIATSLDLAIYDRIEVLRGPAGLFQGPGEPGATINLVRKRPSTEFAAAAGALVGSWNTYRGELDVAGPLVDSGRLRARIVGLYDDRDSFVDIVGSEKWLTYGTVELDVTDMTTLSVGATYQDIDSVMDQGLPAFADGTLADVDRSTFTGADWNRQEITTGDYFIELNHRLENGGHLQASGRKVDRTMYYRAARANSAIDPVTGDFAIQRVEWGRDRETITVDAHGATPFELGGQTHNILIGADYREYEEKRTHFAVGPAFSSNIFNPVHDIPEPDFAPFDPTESEQEQYGVYGQLRMKPINWGTIVVGGRASWWRQVSFSGDRQSVDGEVTPYVALVADLNTNISVYGSYASIFEPQSASTASGDLLEPRTGDQYEIGLKAEFLDGAVLGHLAAYRIEDQNRALQDPSNPMFSIAAGEVRSEGFEAEVSGSPLPGWDILVGYAYTTTEYVTAAATQEGQTFATFTPKHKFNLWTKYEFSKDPLDGLSVGGGVKWVSQFYSESGSVRFVEDGYATVSAQIGYRLSEHLEGAFTVTNLFDEKYYEKVSDARRQNFYGEPRAFLLSVRATW